MIVVTVELWPGGTGKPQHLGTAVIANDGTGDAQHGNYKAALAGKGRGYPSIKQLVDRSHHVWRTAYVSNFPRKRLTAWDLLYRVLSVAVAERNLPAGFEALSTAALAKAGES